jgi:DDE superfamily endonuclease
VEINMNKTMIDIYSDYLITSYRQTSATKLSAALDGAISHDKITRELGGQFLTHKDYWKYIKSTVREIQENTAMIAIDDFILEKPDSDENSVVAYYYDHKSGSTVKGTNVVDAAYITSRGRIPLDFEVVTKDMIPEFNWEKGEFKRIQDKSKNQIAQEILKRAKLHQVPFKTVLLDTWFASSETMNMIKLDLGKEFIVALKCNRKVKLLAETGLMTGLAHDRKGFVQIGLLDLEAGKAYLARVEGVKADVLLTRQVFINEDGSQGILYLAASELCLTDEAINAGYYKRWQVEEQHKSGKQNAMMGKGAASWVIGRVNHIFCGFIALVKLEKMRLKLKLNHFALKERLYLSALRASMASLTELRASMEFREKPA